MKKIKEPEQQITTFSTGSQREEKLDKGRFDLLPPAAYTTHLLYLKNELDLCEQPASSLDTIITEYVAELLSFKSLEKSIEKMCVLAWFLTSEEEDRPMRALAIHYEQGGRNRGDRNWEKGIPMSSFISSGLRHLEQHMLAENDEPHHRALLWNMVAASQTLQWVKDGTLPDTLIDVPVTWTV